MAKKYDLPNQTIYKWPARYSESSLDIESSSASKVKLDDAKELAKLRE